MERIQGKEISKEELYWSNIHILLKTSFNKVYILLISQAIIKIFIIFFLFYVLLRFEEAQSFRFDIYLIAGIYSIIELLHSLYRYSRYRKQIRSLNLDFFHSPETIHLLNK